MEDMQPVQMSKKKNIQQTNAEQVNNFFNILHSFIGLRLWGVPANTKQMVLQLT